MAIFPALQKLTHMWYDKLWGRSQRVVTLLLPYFPYPCQNMALKLLSPLILNSRQLRIFWFPLSGQNHKEGSIPYSPKHRKLANA